jgi:hypothetical protein
MNSRQLGFAIVATLLASTGLAQAQTAQDLVGTWQMISNVNTAADGKKTDGFGPHVTGMAIYASNGTFVIVNGNPDVPKFVSNKRDQGRPA